MLLPALVPPTSPSSHLTHPCILRFRSTRPQVCHGS
jgi:hypothetical protein